MTYGIDGCVIQWNDGWNRCGDEKIHIFPKLSMIPHGLDEAWLNIRWTQERYGYNPIYYYLKNLYCWDPMGQ